MLSRARATMRRLRKKILERLRRNNRDEEVPQSRPDNDPSLEPSAEIASTNLIALPPSQVGSLNDPSSSTHSISGDAPWMVPRPVNPLFMGRSEILKQIEEAIRRNLGESDHSEPCRIVITGIGGQGKSEICLKIANQLRKEFQGVLWVDVSTDELAETGFINIAKAIHCDAKNLEEARQALSSFPKPWLLVLDNADNPTFDYQAYLPTGTYGVVLMTSRNSECSQYATVLGGDLTLEGLDDDSARALLLTAANISPHEDEDTLYEDAQAVCALLKSHPLALIQAGSYVARRHCKLSEYPDKFHHHCKQLLEFFPKQEPSRYRNVYDTFEASAKVLQSSSDDSARDALNILSMLSMIGHSSLPLAIFKATWEGTREIKKNPSNREEVDRVSEQHVEQLISLIDVDPVEWNPYRLRQAIRRLTSLSLITANEKNGCISSISCHPLIHVWAKERQTLQAQYQSWIITGAIFAISSLTDTLWSQYDLQLKPHLEAYLDCKVSDMLDRGPRLIVIQIIMNCARVLSNMRKRSKLLPSLLEDLYETMNLDNKTVTKGWESLYQISGVYLCKQEKFNEGKSLLEEVVKIRKKTLNPENPSRLTSEHELAKAYLAFGKTEEAISLFEEIFRIKKRNLDPENPSLVKSQHELAEAYLGDGKAEEAISLLKEVIKIKKQTLDPENPSLMESQHELAKAYLINDQIKEVISLLEEEIKIDEKSLDLGHQSPLASVYEVERLYGTTAPMKQHILNCESSVAVFQSTMDPGDISRRYAQHSLAAAYLITGRTREAISILKAIDKAKENPENPEDPGRIVSQCNLAENYLANGQAKEAISLLGEASKVAKKIRHPDNYLRKEPQRILAEAYLATGQSKEAIPFLEDVVMCEENLYDPENPYLLDLEHKLATAYLANGQTEEAILLLEDIDMVKEKTHDPNRLSLQHELAQAYEANGQKKEAISLLEEVVRIREMVLDSEHPDLLALQRDLARVSRMNGSLARY